MLAKIADFQRQAPEGYLKVQKKGEKSYFYQQYWDENTKQHVRKYIKKENLSLVKALAQKQYYMLVEPVLKRNLGLLKNVMDQYHPEEIQKIYESISQKRVSFIKPLTKTLEEQIRQWMEEKYEKNNCYPENLRYQTEQGEMVRSKSEVIIANILYQHKKNILYKYERPLEVLIGGRIKIIYPDFTILNLHTGKIVYWEHAGKMDDPHYANEFIKKVNTYVENNILPGRDVVFSYETIENSLEISVIKKMVDEIENRINLYW